MFFPRVNKQIFMDFSIKKSKNLYSKTWKFSSSRSQPTRYSLRENHSKLHSRQTYSRLIDLLWKFSSLYKAEIVCSGRLQVETMTLNLPRLYCFWFLEYCQTSSKENKSPNLWPITSILVYCIFDSRNLLFAFWSLHSSYVICQHNSLRISSSGKQESNQNNWRKTDKWGLAFGWCQIESEN